MLELEKLFYALRANRELEEEAREMGVVIIQRIREIVESAIDTCNNDPDCQYIIKSFEVSIDRTLSDPVINMDSLINRESGHRVSGKSLNSEALELLEKEIGEILTGILEKPIRVAIDS